MVGWWEVAGDWTDCNWLAGWLSACFGLFPTVQARLQRRGGVWFFSTFLEANLPHPHGRLPHGRLVPHFGSLSYPAGDSFLFLHHRKRYLVVLVEGGENFLPSL
jgi:hypothetical protein